VNTFALLLLAFPFYLAVNGRLVTYTALATTAAAGGSVAPTTAQPASTPVASTAPQVPVTAGAEPASIAA
jgi:hypothetical protein